MSNDDINVDRQTDGLTDGRKIGRLYRTLLQAGAIKIHYNIHVCCRTKVCLLDDSNEMQQNMLWNPGTNCSKLMMSLVNVLLKV